MRGVEPLKVVLQPHSAEWAAEFERARAVICAAWGDNVLSVEHIGSTAIIGIWAKPILDIAVILKSFAEMDVSALRAVGYTYIGYRQPDARHFFLREDENGREIEYIHCYEPGNADLARCLRFRDYLNAHPDAAEEYSRLKIKLAQAHADDRYAYSAAKADFITNILRLSAAD